ncbi:hypothetical protein M434DRAFT_380111 [Hypoxylon sp. CO27-5]|nr:hypothetical protein M434DRAFT_380111 [Hypoxylon sp. CO27-5]
MFALLALFQGSNTFTFWTIFLSFVVLAIYRRYLSPLSNVPGPFWASITRLWHAYHVFKGDHNLHQIGLHNHFGYFVRIAPDEVSVSHPDGPHLLLQATLRKADWYRVFAMPDYRYATPQSTLDAKEKIERSKLFMAGFSKSHLLRSEPYFNKNIGLLLDWMDKYSETQEPMHLDKFFSYTAFDNAGEAVFSQSFGFIAKGEDIRGSIKNSRALNRYMGVAGFFLWLHMLLVANPIITWAGVMPMGHLSVTANEALRKRMADPDARFDILAHWLKTHQENPEALSFRDIEAQATTSVAAGSDTVSCAIQTFVYHMIKYQASWRRARSEIEEAQLQGRCKGRIVSYHDSQLLPYLQACINEALRMFGPGPFGLPRRAPKGGITIGNHHFPEGTILSINPHVMQQSKDCWGPDAKEWNPDRWFADDIQFGLGYNKCPGEHLAEIQLSKIAATIIRDYSIRQVDPQNEWKWEAYFLVVPHSWPVYIEKST